MTHKELLQSRIDGMQALVTSQEERYNAATRCLSQTKAALAIDDVVAKVNGRKLTYEELEFQHRLVCEAADNVTKSLDSIGKMRNELREMENELLFLQAKSMTATEPSFMSNPTLKRDCAKARRPSP